ncbi:MAG: transposase [Deltaproteobacteria bacterium]|nr:transposase [Deltaproteobacteria bacterium]MBT7893021.1 transposase [Deltaproteobacteria bacterium]
MALIYKLRWDVEKFFGWWKRQLNVYHLISRTEYGLMVQIVTGLITYLLMAIYCHNQYKEKVSIKRVRELRSQILNEALATKPQRCQKSSRRRKKKPKPKRAKS